MHNAFGILSQFVPDYNNYVLFREDLTMNNKPVAYNIRQLVLTTLFYPTLQNENLEGQIKTSTIKKYRLSIEQIVVTPKHQNIQGKITN